MVVASSLDVVGRTGCALLPLPILELAKIRRLLLVTKLLRGVGVGLFIRRASKMLRLKFPLTIGASRRSAVRQEEALGRSLKLALLMLTSTLSLLGQLKSGERVA